MSKPCNFSFETPLSNVHVLAVSTRFQFDSSCRIVVIAASKAYMHARIMYCMQQFARMVAVSQHDLDVGSLLERYDARSRFDRRGAGLHILRERVVGTRSAETGAST